MSHQEDYIFKICVVGDNGIGKTAFIESFVPESYFKKGSRVARRTGINFYLETITIETDSGPKNCKIQIWDTGGQERYNFIRPQYYKGAEGIMLFFDLANRDSFTHLNDWIIEVRKSLKSEERRRKRKGIREIPILLIGNKGTLDQFAVSPIEINQFISKNNLVYIETSTKKREGISDSFYCITSLILGIDINSEYFLSKDIIYHPKPDPIKGNSIKPKLTPKDLINLSQKAILDRLETLEKKFDNMKSHEIQLRERELKLKEKELDIKEKKLKQVNVVDDFTTMSKDILVFVSYATKDADLFKVKEISKALANFRKIKEVLYWQEHMEDNIIKYMSDNLGKCDIMLLFCSPNALKSKAIEKEWTSADMMNKPIIPIFIKPDHIPPLLKSRLGVEFDTFDLQKTINEIYSLIMKKSENRLIDIKD
ncbi:MAG: GTP-binding protein, partial [Candidatus Hodarchaeota archaeon]